MPPPSLLVLPFSIVKLFKKTVPALMVNTDAPPNPVPLKVPEPCRVKLCEVVKFPVQVPCTTSVAPGNAAPMAVCKLPPALQFTVVGVMAEAGTPPPITKPSTTLPNTSEPASTARRLLPRGIPN
jgi:hypothetical protein